MSLLTLATATLVEGRPGRLARRNPVAKLVAATLPGIVLLLSLDAVAPAVFLLVLLGCLPLAQLDLRRVARRSLPLLFAAVLLGVVNAAFAAHPHGRPIFHLGPVHLTSNSFLLGLAISLRALGIALPGVLVLASTDPVDLADSLVQQGRVPPKFAYGTLAAVRLLPLLSVEWQVIAMARRARGIDAGRSPLRAARLFASQVFGLLVVAIRRGTRLATAMDARGFDSGLPRTVARLQRVTAADLALVAAAVAVALGSVAVSIAVGAWQPLVLG